MIHTIIRQKKTLKAQLVEMPIGEKALVRYIHFSNVYVRRAVMELNRSGYSFEASERGEIEGVRVTRLK